MPSIRAWLCRAALRAARNAFDPRVTTLAQMRANGERMASRSKPVRGIRVEQVTHAGACGTLSGEWLRPPSEAGLTLLYVHSGGFCLDYGAPHRALAARLALSAKANTFALRYQLAPEHAYPAGLDDCVAAYSWLLQTHSSHQLAVGGDSAGAVLCLEAMLRARERGLPMPAALFLLCPMGLDLGFSAPSYSQLAACDPMNSLESLRPYAALYQRNATKELIDEDFTGLPPTLVQAGSNEVFRAECELVHQRMDAAGVDVTLELWSGMWHTFQCFAPWVPEAQRAIDEVASFVRSKACKS